MISMSRIIADFIKAHIPLIIRYAVVAAICTAGFVLTGIFSRDTTRIAGIAVSVFIGALLIKVLLDIFIVSPIKFRRKMNNLSEKQRGAVESEYPKARSLGKRWFMTEYILFYSYRKIILLGYDEVDSAHSKGHNIFITDKNNKTVLMPVEPGENADILLAVLKNTVKGIIVNDK